MKRTFNIMSPAILLLAQIALENDAEDSVEMVKAIAEKTYDTKWADPTETAEERDSNLKHLCAALVCAMELYKRNEN